MKKILRNVLVVVTLMAFLLVPCMSVRAAEVEVPEELPEAIEVSTEEELVAALAHDELTVVKLTQDISLTAPLYVNSEVLLDGAGFTLDGTNIVADGSNKSIITASGKDAGDLLLQNIKLVNAPKYGVQAYDGGSVILDGVTIQECKFGAVLINGGNVAVMDLTMVKNGNFEDGKTGNGIELAKGDAVAEGNDPYLIMAGTLTTQDQDTVLWIAEDNPKLENILYGTAEDSPYKLAVEGDALVLKDADGNVVATSNAVLSNLNTENPLEPTDPDTPVDPTPEEPTTPEENPNTSDGLILFVVLAIVGLGLCAVSLKKLCK